MNKWWIWARSTLVCIGQVPPDDPSVMLKRTDLIERGKEIRKLLDQAHRQLAQALPAFAC